MFIQTESTPNPATLKFVPGCAVAKSGPIEFADADQAQISPLARALFNVRGVMGVFFGPDFVTITKDASVDWSHIKPALLGVIMDHFVAGLPVLEDTGAKPAEHADNDGEPPEITGKIKELLDTRVRPAVAQDGGDITFHGFKEGVVYLKMRGACAGCPSATMTLKAGIENLLRYYIPEVTEVRPVDIT